MASAAAPTPRRRSTALQSFSLRKTSDVDIVLDDETDQSFVSSYTTMDRISGRVIIRCPKDTSFQVLEITFEGITDTYIEKVATTAATSGRSTGKHKFLKLQQPIDASQFPEGMVAKAGVPYDFPFEFVVPDRLLDQNCKHRIDSPEVHEAHMQVPPSFGDPMLAGDGVSLQDDLAPEMSKIQYIIRARMIKAHFTATKSSDVADKAIKVRIVPGREEDPPLNITEDNKDYEVRKEKDIRKGLFKGKLGRIVAEAPQPSGFRLPALKNRNQRPISTMTTVNLRFDPSDDKAMPPPLGSLSSKLRAQTFFGSVPFRAIPSRSSMTAWDTQRGSYVQSVELSTRCISSVEWQKHPATENPTTGDDGIDRRTSDLSSLSSTINTTNPSAHIPAPSSAYRPGSHFFTASVLVPMALPRTKSFAPTFHTCSVSRIYQLDLILSYHTPGTTVSVPTIGLKLPIQISAEGNPDARPEISMEDAEAIAAREVDEELAQGRYDPRSVAPPPQVPGYEPRETPQVLPAFRGLGRDRETEPPGYSSLRGGWAGASGDDFPESAVPTAGTFAGQTGHEAPSPLEVGRRSVLCT